MFLQPLVGTPRRIRVFYPLRRRSIDEMTDFLTNGEDKCNLSALSARSNLTALLSLYLILCHLCETLLALNQLWPRR